MKHIKTSNKILAGLLAVIFITISIVILVNGFQYQASQKVNIAKMTPVSLAEFSNISVSGNIIIEILNSDNQQVLVMKKMIDDADFKLNSENGTLFITYTNESKNPNIKPQIAIKTNIISSLSVTNKANIIMHNFKHDSLFINQNGGSVNIDSLWVEQLHLNLYNSSTLWCNNLIVNNMRVCLSNSVFCKFATITAKKVSGAIKDKSQFIAKGSIEEFNVRVDSTGRIDKYY